MVIASKNASEHKMHRRAFAIKLEKAWRTSIYCFRETKWPFFQARVQNVCAYVTFPTVNQS